MSPKKIAILCNYVLKPNRIGGMDRFYKLLDSKLKEKKCQIDWYFLDAKEFDFYKDVTVFSAKGNSVEEFFISESKRGKHKYDIIITHFTELCTPYYKIFRQLNPKVYSIAVDHNPRPLKGFVFKKQIKKRIDGILYSRYINQFIGVSKYTRHHILKDYGSFLGKKTKVVYNGIDVDVFEKRNKKNENRFIVASHLRKSKGIQDLLQALNLINRDLLSGIIVDIYGSGPYEDILKKMSNSLQLNTVVKFKGSSPNLNTLFSTYRYMIQPTYMECFSLSILESLSANVPVISTTVGGNLELLTNDLNSYIYNPGDIGKLSSILEDIITGKKSICEDVSILVRANFYLEKMVDEHIKLIPCI